MRVTATYGDVFSKIPNLQSPNSMFTGTTWGYGDTPPAVLTDANVRSLVDGVVNAAPGGGDTEAIYLLLTGPNVYQGANATYGFCSQYCGWHGNYVKGSNIIKYAWIGKRTYPLDAHADTVKLLDCMSTVALNDSVS
jgi:hypothetical protein